MKDISELTGFPEMLDGRVKTLHPKVHGGILHIAREDAEHGRRWPSMAFSRSTWWWSTFTPSKRLRPSRACFEELIENIDIGGPSMIRSAAKNFQDVAVVTSPADYEAICAGDGAANGGALSLATQVAAGAEGVCHDGGLRLGDRFDAGAIARGRDGSSSKLQAAARRFPRDAAAQLSTRRWICATARIRTRKRRCTPTVRARAWPMAKQLQGKELSYNNIVDLQAAWDLAQEFDEPVCAIIKHTNPCGTATGKTLAEAYVRALECDPVSAFGGVIGVNRPIDAAAATEMAKLFLEVIAAPAFDDAARKIFASKKNLRLVEVPHRVQQRLGAEEHLRRHAAAGCRPAPAGRGRSESGDEAARRRAEEKRALLFAWKVCKHVKSNAILYARDGQTVGVGAGQMSRVDSCKIGAMKAQLPLKGTVAASDAFFPFPDGVEEIAKAGATAIIQPGGSVRDQEVIEAADRLGLAMIFTGVRHFRH